MYDVWAIHITLKNETESRHGYLAYATTLKNPEFKLMYVLDEDIQNDFDEVAMFLSFNYAQHVLSKLKVFIDNEKQNPDITYDLIKFNVNQAQLENFITRSWKIENA